MSDSLAGQVALVTGSSQGIGMAVALELGRRGASVAVNVPDSATSPNETLTALQGLGVRTASFVADVSRSSEVEAMVAAVGRDLGAIDVLVSNAAIYPRYNMVDCPEEIWDRTIDVNLKGTWLVARAVAKGMIERKSGRIVTLSSGAALRGAAGGAHYSASKAGIIALTKSLALELAPYGIRVNCVAPTVTDTPMPRGVLTEKEWEARRAAIPLGRICHPNDVARAVAYLVGPDSAFVTGQTLHVNGGDLMP